MMVSEAKPSEGCVEPATLIVPTVVGAEFFQPMPFSKSVCISVPGRSEVEAGDPAPQEAVIEIKASA